MEQMQLFAKIVVSKKDAPIKNLKWYGLPKYHTKIALGPLLNTLSVMFDRVLNTLQTCTEKYSGRSYWVWKNYFHLTITLQVIGMD